VDRGEPMIRPRTDLLILGAGGAGPFAALHAHSANPSLYVAIAVKRHLGKCGCKRRVQGGCNVALAPGESVERHFTDTIESGRWLPEHDLAWTLVNGAIERIDEFENEPGCFFGRNPDGTLCFGTETGTVAQAPHRPRGVIRSHRTFVLCVRSLPTLPHPPARRRIEAGRISPR
jgi:succinate dehydrogenase/fumarate reductase flavoprotein subunit